MSSRAELFAAVEVADAARVRDLLAADPALVRARDDLGATALHYAAERGDRALVRLLLEHGAAINARDERFHATPAGWAIGDEEIARLFPPGAGPGAESAAPPERSSR